MGDRERDRDHHHHAGVASAGFFSTRALVTAGFALLLIIASFLALDRIALPAADSVRLRDFALVDLANASAASLAAASVASPYSALRTRIPPCAAGLPPARGFLMLMTSHSGSTAAVSQLRAHPDVRDGQLLEPLHPSRPKRSVQALAREYWGNALSHNQLGGFKVNVRSMMDNPDDWIAVIEEYGVRVLHNLRHNHFKRAVGLYPSDYLNDTTAVSGAKIGVEVGPVNFKVDDFKGLHCTMINSVEIQTWQTDLIRKVAPCHLKVPYEEYLEYPDLVMAQVYEFLGLPQSDAESNRQKVTSDNMCETISNFADVCAHFDGCSTWHPYMDDPENKCQCKHYKYESKGGDADNPFCQWENVDYCRK